MMGKVVCNVVKLHEAKAKIAELEEMLRHLAICSLNNHGHHTTAEEALAYLKKESEE